MAKKISREKLLEIVTNYCASNLGVDKNDLKERKKKIEEEDSCYFVKIYPQKGNRFSYEIIIEVNKITKRAYHLTKDKSTNRCHPFNPGLIAFKDNFSNFDSDKLLHKIFPNLSFTNGTVDYRKGFPRYLNLYLEKQIRGSFITSEENNLLFVVKLKDTSNDKKIYHVYLGLFDDKGNLLTPKSSYPLPNDNNHYDFSLDKSHFGGDKGELKLYNCKGIRYIVFAFNFHPEEKFCFGKVKVFKIEKANFRKVQSINSKSFAGFSNGSEVSLLHDGIIITLNYEIKN